jgi:hypothetical protein
MSQRLTDGDAKSNRGRTDVRSGWRTGAAMGTSGVPTLQII